MPPFYSDSLEPPSAANFQDDVSDGADDLFILSEDEDEMTPKRPTRYGAV